MFLPPLAALARFALGVTITWSRLLLHIGSLRLIACLLSQSRFQVVCIQSWVIVFHMEVEFRLCCPFFWSGANSQCISRNGRASTSSPLATPGIMHGSTLSNDSTQHSDSWILSDAVTNGFINHTRPRPLNNAIYSQCVLAMCSLAKDPTTYCRSWPESHFHFWDWTGCCQIF